MKIKIAFLLVSVLLSIKAFSQENNDAVERSDTNRLYSTQIYTSMSFGKDCFGHNYTANNFGVNFAQKLNDRAKIYIGANITSLNARAELIDRSPRRTTTAGSMYIGADYKVNDKLQIYADVFFNTLYNMIGTDIALTYRFSEESVLHISASFARSTFSPYNQAVPYWYNNAFEPFVFGY